MQQWIRPDWDAPSSVVAVSTTRDGGISTGSFASMNLGAHVGDTADAVSENRRRLKDALGSDVEPAWLKQVHGTDVIDAGRLPVDAPPPAADAAFTVRPGAACVVMTADCLPVLLAARDGSAVAAAHAGWRGLAGGVLEATVARMPTPADALVAWLGPAISQPAFEVGDEVREAFIDHDDSAAAFFAKNARGRWQADLYALARQRLEAAGLTAVSGGGYCTFTDAERFFSHRRDPGAGRMATAILIRSAPGT